MKTSKDLKAILEKIDHRGYPAYKDAKGSYQFCNFIFNLDHVQSDPFASPSDVSVQLPNSFPAGYYNTPWKKRALEDWLLVQFGSRLKSSKAGSGKSGKMRISRPGPEILSRSACVVDSNSITLRFHIGLPAQGRRIDIRPLLPLLFTQIPDIIDSVLIYKNLTAQMKEQLEQAIFLAEDQHAIRQLLKEKGLVAFVANGAILPRSSGASSSPMENAVPFVSPESLEVELDLPHAGKMKGMGIPKGITLIVGGGYHGKSTLLQALQNGIYDHRAGDGREYVILDDSAVKIRSEDGRAITGTDISPFIQNLPQKKDTKHFVSKDASGSTSQAANVMEAIASGANVLLVDEDTSATNFMQRDSLMHDVISPDQEPIIPFLERIEDMKEQGISTILVAGSSGSFFAPADVIIQMDQYTPKDITASAREKLARWQEKYPGAMPIIQRERADFMQARNIAPLSICQQDKVKIKSHDLDTISINHQDLDVRYLEQLVDYEQLPAIGAMIKYLSNQVLPQQPDLKKAVEKGLADVEQKGFGILGRKDFCAVRPQEIMAAILRMRTLESRDE